MAPFVRLKTPDFIELTRQKICCIDRAIMTYVTRHISATRCTTLAALLLLRKHWNSVRHGCVYRWINDSIAQTFLFSVSRHNDQECLPYQIFSPLAVFIPYPTEKVAIIRRFLISRFVRVDPSKRCLLVLERAPCSNNREASMLRNDIENFSYFAFGRNCWKHDERDVGVAKRTNKSTYIRLFMER